MTSQEALTVLQLHRSKYPQHAETIDMITLQYKEK